MPEPAIETQDATPFGEELATRAVAFLQSRVWIEHIGAIARAHRDYTGHGLFFDRTTGQFFLGASQDGMPYGSPFLTFDDANSFVGWLSVQSDRSLSGYVRNASPDYPPNFYAEAGNQRVTRQMLIDYLAREAR